MEEAQHAVHMVAATVGFLSYGLLWIAAVWGVVLKNGWGFTRVRHATLYGIHRTVTMVGLTLGVVHAFAQLAVPGGPMRLIDVFVPFLNPADRVGVGVGVIALEVLVALVLSVLVQRWLGHHRWRKLHMLGYVAYVLLTVHVLVSGSDTQSMLVRLPVLASLIILIALASATTIVSRVSRSGSAVAGPSDDVVLNVDPSRCVRYGFCVHEAPDLFRLRTDGRLNFRTAVPPEQIEQALRAAQACPARAILLGRRPTSMVMASEPTHAQPDQNGRPTLHPVNGGLSDPRPPAT